MGYSEGEIEKIISEKIHSLTLKKISSANDELIESGILNSVTLVELAVELEKFFSVQFSFMEVNKENFRNPASIAKLMSQKLI